MNACNETPKVNFEGRDDSKFVGQWVQAKYLKVGDKVLLSDGKTAILTKTELEHLSEPIMTYNFEVEDFHTYYVGEQGILVHNSCRGEVVRKAWKMEQQNAIDGKALSRDWTPDELIQLINNGKVKGYVGHHINSVKGYPNLVGDPNNIIFLTRYEHFAAHGFNWRNITSGLLIYR